MAESAFSWLDLSGRVIVITGGGGLLGCKHGEAVAEMGGIPVLVDIDETAARRAADAIGNTLGRRVVAHGCDITDASGVRRLRDAIVAEEGRVDGLVNNAANNPKIVADASSGGGHFSRLEQFPLELWRQDIEVGLTGAFLCSQAFGPLMAEAGRGVILNIGSDLSIIAPDQRLYRDTGRDDAEQPVKPVTYSVVKAGLLGLTRYLATYWADRGVRANALLPGGVYAGQPDDFVARLTSLIPMGRMAEPDEYKAAVAFLLSDGSAYMNGAFLVMDGGRTAW